MRNRKVILEVELAVEADYTMNVKEALKHVRECLRVSSWAGAKSKGKYRAWVRKTQVLSDTKRTRMDNKE